MCTCPDLLACHGYRRPQGSQNRQTSQEPAGLFLDRALLIADERENLDLAS
jgi:hypothetical protein